MDELFVQTVREMNWLQLHKSFQRQHLARIEFATSHLDCGKSVHDTMTSGYWRSNSSVEVYCRDASVVPALLRLTEWPIRQPNVVRRQVSISNSMEHLKSEKFSIELISTVHGTLHSLVSARTSVKNTSKNSERESSSYSIF